MTQQRTSRYSGVYNTARMIAAEEGPKALFGGLSATILCALPSAALYFGTYEAVKRIGVRHVPDGAEPLVHLCAGAASELTSSVVAVPFEVIKCRMQLGVNPMRATNGAVPVTGNYSNALQGLRAVAATQGLEGLYAGFRPCIMLDCCFSALQFALYEWSHAYVSERKAAWWKERQQRANQHQPIREADGELLHRHSEAFTPAAATGGVGTRERVDEVHIAQSRHAGVDADADANAELLLRALGLGADLSCGGFAGGIAALLTNPLDVATARLMTQLPKGRGRSYAGTWDCLKRVAQEEGGRALWAGSAARVLSVMPLAALQFSVYEQMKSWLRLQ
jgi:hypothetical protein